MKPLSVLLLAALLLFVGCSSSVPFQRKPIACADRWAAVWERTGVPYKFDTQEEAEEYAAEARLRLKDNWKVRRVTPEECAEDRRIEVEVQRHMDEWRKRQGK